MNPYFIVDIIGCMDMDTGIDLDTMLVIALGMEIIILFQTMIVVIRKNKKLLKLKKFLLIWKKIGKKKAT